MARKQEQYRFRNHITPLDERELNRRFFDVDARLDQVEQTRVDWEAAIAALNAAGLGRVAELLAQIGEQATAQFAAEDQTFSASEQTRDATLAAALAAATADLASDQATFEQLASDLNAIIAASGNSGADIIALQLWRDTLDPPRDGFLWPDRLRSGAAAITYDGSGQITRIDTTLPGNIVFRQDYTYAGDGAVSQIVGKLGAVTLWTCSYSYDGNGNVTGWTET